jgi:hypothetical protein
MRRITSSNFVLAVVLIIWLGSLAAAFPLVLGSEAIAANQLTENSCQAEAIPGTGCPVNGNGCGGCNGGTGKNCQSKAGGTCALGGAGCPNGLGCWCNPFSC